MSTYVYTGGRLTIPRPKREKMSTYVYAGGRPSKSEGKGITHVTVQDGVVSIDDDAFKSWRNLVSVLIPSSVTRIGTCVFRFCYSLSSINLPTSLEYIGNYAFSYCENLSVIELPDSLVDIGEYAFRACSSLSSITIPPSMTRIQRGTFQGCTSLSQVIIPPSVIDIGENAFWGCSSLTSIKLPTELQIITNHAFQSCKSLESIQIPLTTTSIGNEAFHDSSSLKIIYTPSSAIHGSTWIFAYCDANLIILTDVDGFEYEGYQIHQTITLNDIHQCIQDLPNHDIPTNEQLDTLHHVFYQRFPDMAIKTQRSGFNLLHLLVYFPGIIYQPLSTLLAKCPQATIDVDWKGKTPLHHAIESTKHNMDVNSYNLLVRHSPDTVVHQAIEAGLHGDDLHELVKAKTNALTIPNDESRLLPFMMAAVEGSQYEGSACLALSTSFLLLSMDPSVLQDYISR